MKRTGKVLSLLLGGGVLLSCISNSQTQAATVTRQSNIKSHGVFQSNDAAGKQEVLLDSADLLYLAGECDKLESVISGLSLTNNPNISYTRHHHSGSIYANGGCYTSGYHAHSGSEYSYGGCYTNGYHVHTSSCSKTHTHTANCPMTHEHNSSCPKHRHTSSCYTKKKVHTHGDGSCNDVSFTAHKSCGCTHQCEGSTCSACSHGNHGENACSAQVPFTEHGCNKQEYANVLTCTKGGTYTCNSSPLNTYTCNNSPLNTYTCGSPNNRWSLGCGNSPTNRWALTCGWNENEIMEAHIVFSK